MPQPFVPAGVLIRDRCPSVNIQVDGTAIAEVASKGQISLPAATRQELGIKPHSKVEVIVGDNEIIVRPLRSIMELEGVFQSHTKGKSMDWEQVRTEMERAVARHVARE